MQELEFDSQGKPPTVVQRVTRRWIEQHSQGMRVTAEERTVVRSRRNINATPWGRSDGSEPLRVPPTRVARNRQAAEEAEERARLEVDLLRQLMSADDPFTRANAKELLYLQYTLDALGQITPETFGDSPLQPLSVEQSSQLLPLYQQTPNEIPSIIEHLQDEDIDIVQDKETVSLPLPDNTLVPEIDEISSMEKDLNSQQKLVLDILVKTLRHRVPSVRDNVDQLAPQQAFVFAHGGPGTGKTFIARCIVEHLKSMGLESYCIAPTGNASGNLPKGRTIHNGLGISYKQPQDSCCPELLNDQLCKMQSRIQKEKIALLIIDEVSCVTAAMLSHIDQRLKQIMGCFDRPFGDLSVLVMGDMFQLPPVKGDPIYKEIIEHSLQQKELPRGKKRPLPDTDKPNFHGTLLFQRF